MLVVSTDRLPQLVYFGAFFFIKPPTAEIYTLSLHDALPISVFRRRPSWRSAPLATSSTAGAGRNRSEEHTSELQSRLHLVCRLLLEKKNIGDGVASGGASVRGVFLRRDDAAATNGARCRNGR